MPFFIGPYVADGDNWLLPKGATSGVPIRAPEHDDNGGLLLFRSVYPQSREYRNLGNAGGQISEPDKRWILSRLGMRGSFATDHWQTAIYELLTTKSDPRGIDTSPAKRPNDRGHNRLVCDGVELINRKVDLQSSPESASIVARIRWMYREQRRKSRDGSDYRKWLTRLTERHSGYDYRLFQGSEPDEAPLPHDTTISDDFGTDETAGAGDFFLDLQSSGQWTMFSAGVYDVASNRLVKTGNSNVGIRCDGTTFSSSDMYTWCVVRVGELAGPAVAYDSASYASYFGYFYRTGSTVHIRRATSNTAWTELTNAAYTAPANPIAVKLEYDADEILRVYADAGTSEPTTVRITSSTDTTLDAYANAGAHIYSDAASISDWNAGDLVSASNQQTLALLGVGA